MNGYNVNCNHLRTQVEGGDYVEDAYAASDPLNQVARPVKGNLSGSALPLMIGRV